MRKLHKDQQLTFYQKQWRSEAVGWHIQSAESENNCQLVSYKKKNYLWKNKGEVNISQVKQIQR